MYKRQGFGFGSTAKAFTLVTALEAGYPTTASVYAEKASPCLLYTSDAADERSSVDLGGRRIIKQKNKNNKKKKISVL